MRLVPRRLRRYGIAGIVGLLALGVLFLIVRAYQGRLPLFNRMSPGALPTPLPTPETPLIADAFDFPLDPAHFGVYIQGESGALPVDTRFGAQNPGLGSAGKCFVDQEGEHVPFNRLYHAGEDWFALNAKGRVVWGKSAGAEVRAVANGVVESATLMGYDGYVLIVRHTLPDATAVWSVYWHVADVQVAQGQAVSLGQPLAAIHNRGSNSHLHWEIRTFADGSALFPADSAGGRGTCNGYVTGVGYTWDDDPAQAGPTAWGYLNPSQFVTDRK